MNLGTDSDLARMMISDLAGSPALSPDSAPAMIRITVSAWLARRVAEGGRVNGEADAWRSLAPRVNGIAGAALVVLGAEGDRQPVKGYPGDSLPPGPPADRPWQADDQTGRVGGLTPAEIDGLTVEQYAAFRERLGLGQVSAGLLTN